MGVKIQIISKKFENNEDIPKKYTCEGRDVNPPLEINNIPNKTKSLALIVDDPDGSSGAWTHWIVWNIPPTLKIEENSIPGKQGINDFGKTGYKGPCPPSGRHRYYFKLYALDKMLILEEGSNREKLISEMQGHIIESCNTMGRYSKNFKRR
jgi:Raf kinase inhibitor-like YbhB/YbcL family protein